MPKTTAEKIAERKAQIEQLQNQCKKLMAEQKEKERKARTNRLCKRMGLLEGLLPDTIALTDEQFKTFLDKTVANDYGRRILNGIKAQPEPKPDEMQPQNGIPTNLPGRTNAAESDDDSDEDDGGDEYEDVTESG